MMAEKDISSKHSINGIKSYLYRIDESQKLESEYPDHSVNFFSINYF